MNLTKYLRVFLMLFVAVSVMPHTFGEEAAAEIPGKENPSESLDSTQTLSPMQQAISEDLINIEVLQEAIERQAGHETVRLTLEECIQLALQGNQDVLVTSYEPLRAHAEEFAAKGEFDPIWKTNAGYAFSSVLASQQIQAFGGISNFRTYVTTVNSTVAGKLQTGTMYTLAFDATKEETTFGNYIEDFETRLNLTLTQPLLRGFGRNTNRIRIRAAQNAQKIGEAQFRLAVMKALADVIKAYWDLVGTVENLRVRQQALDNARRLLEVSTKRRDLGLAADIEVLQAKAGVATRQSDLIAARARVEDAADVLKNLIGLKEGGSLTRAQVVPVDRPNPEHLALVNPAQPELDVEACVAKALENRPEIMVSEYTIENARLDEKRTRNEMLPQFDIFGSVGQGGRDHKLRKALYGIRDGEQEFYGYGFQATVPIFNRAARGAYQRAQVIRRQAEQRLEQTKQSLVLNVRLAVRNLLTNRVLVESNEQAVRLQEQNVIAEEKRLRLGTTTSYQVLQVQEDLTAAQTMLLQAQIAYEKALVDLYLAQGTLLDEYGVDAQPPAPEKPVGWFAGYMPWTPEE
jgi:outer membrane protein TolC